MQWTCEPGFGFCKWCRYNSMTHSRKWHAIATSKNFIYRKWKITTERARARKREIDELYLAWKCANFSLRVVCNAELSMLLAHWKHRQSESERERERARTQKLFNVIHQFSRFTVLFNTICAFNFIMSGYL